MKRIVLIAVIVFGLQQTAVSCEAYLLAMQRRQQPPSPLEYRYYSRNEFRIFARFEWKDQLDFFVAPPFSAGMPLYKFPGTQFSRGAVFCRMETYTQKKFSVMFSIHTGGYKERY
jgi:hypothetical protein